MSRQSSRPRRSSAQSLVEFALLLPVLALIVMFGIDFGRVFLGWVTLNNSVRQAASFAAAHPFAWGVIPDSVAQAEYERLVRAEAAQINCSLPGTVPSPTFPEGQEIGEPAVAAITCQFPILTPIIGSIIGDGLPVSASAAFPIRAGAIAGVPVEPRAPVPTVEPTPSFEPEPSVSLDPSAEPPPPTATPAPPTPTPAPVCTVPNLVGRDTKEAQNYWGTKGRGSTPGAGFRTNVIFDPLVGPKSQYPIGRQSLSPGETLPCDTTFITVRP